MRDRSRAVRRHHVARLKVKRRHYGYGDSQSGPLSTKHAGSVVNTPRPCSCWMCGNPRRYFGEPTMPERRARTPEDVGGE